MSPDPQVFDHFNAEARTYAKRSGGWLWAPLRRHEGKAIMRALDPQPGERILDAGCGAGHYMSLIQQRGAEVRGVDGAEVMVSAAQKSGFDVELHDLEAAAPPGGPYDKILCAGALEFCRDPKRVVYHLAEALRPGGRLLVFVPRESALGRLYRWSHRRHGLRIHLLRERDLWAWQGPGLQLQVVETIAFSLIGRYIGL
jgi:2-polyprenyl-3-methyl-5-hydroxy-6-metoxy-1,4-benzoquinol methylase